MGRQQRRLVRHRVSGMVVYEGDGMVGNKDWVPVDGGEPTASDPRERGEAPLDLNTPTSAIPVPETFGTQADLDAAALLDVPVPDEVEPPLPEMPEVSFTVQPRSKK